MNAFVDKNQGVLDNCIKDPSRYVLSCIDWAAKLRHNERFIGC